MDIGSKEFIGEIVEILLVALVIMLCGELLSDSLDGYNLYVDYYNWFVDFWNGT